MTKSLELLAKPLIAEWWRRFEKKFEYKYLNDEVVSYPDVFRFFGLQCGLTRCQTKQLAVIFSEFKWIKAERYGWRILKTQEKEFEEI